MFRFLWQTVKVVTCLGVIAGIFFLKMAPDILPKDQMQALHKALPMLYYEKRVPAPRQQAAPRLTSRPTITDDMPDNLKAVLSHSN